MIIDRLIFKGNKALSALIFNKIYKTQPAESLAAEDFAVLSMVQHKDIAMYLLAAKSFLRYCSASKVIVVADKSLTGSDKDLLKRHIPQLSIVEAGDFCSSKTPKGGCWERLYAISTFVKESYVIQLDADTLTLGVPEEISSAVRQNQGFLIGTKDDQEFSPSVEYAQKAKAALNGDDDHIQTIAESFIDQFPKANGRYAKGSAAFSGFPKGSFSREDLETLSSFMYEAIGNKWENWGSEQFASNYIVSNFEGSTVLPHPKYCAVHRRNADTIFVHFPGYVRYKDGVYLKYGAKVINELQSL